jgi:hypothetical protein
MLHVPLEDEAARLLLLEPSSRPDGYGVQLMRSTGHVGRVVVDAARPLIVESTDATGTAYRTSVPYSTLEHAMAGSWTGSAAVSDATGSRFVVVDEWTAVDFDSWRVDRRVEVEHAAQGAAARFLLELIPRVGGGDSFDHFRYFAPGAMYDLNDLNGDHVDDYADTQTLLYRDDRLSAMAVLAHHATAAVGFMLARADVPAFDPAPEREHGQTTVLQQTDIGSLGVFPAGSRGGCVLAAAYPFVERNRSHALDVRARPGWGAYWPLQEGDVLTASYLVRAFDAMTPHEALWSCWLHRLRDLDPQPVQLTTTLDDITAHRVEALLDYYAEDEDGAAGFVTNCHPQDGRQLGNVIQYGFTGQNLLNAYCVLRAPAPSDVGIERRRRALLVIDFYVADALRNPHGLVHGLYNMDLRRYASWWTGLLLPLAYAEPGEDLERLMGPLYDHLRPVIEALQGRDGTYLRCLGEEYDALLQAYEFEHALGNSHEDWLHAALRFGRFLASVQEPDGSWFRAYDLDGSPLTDPDFWFGQTDVQRKSSTATVVPFLLRLHRITGDERWVGVSERACRYVDEAFVQGLKFNGGIHDSMYAKPQLVDHESIIFAFRALLELHRTTEQPALLESAVRAAWIVCSWAWLWDVPLPPDSTLARFGFRSTGWTGCDTPGAGYIHPMGVVVVPDLVEVAQLTGEAAFLRMAELIMFASNENVALPGKDWGYARPGLQEEGLQVSWCCADDPMFTNTEFGGRRKGEGNKTCFPWISAVTIWAYQELLARYRTADPGELRAAGIPA